MTTDTRSGTGTRHHLQCAVCGTYIELEGQTVNCSKCKTDAPLQAAILTIMAQADEDGRLIDIQSIRSGIDGRLTYQFLPEQKARRGQSKAGESPILPRIRNRKDSA